MNMLIQEQHFIDLSATAKPFSYAPSTVVPPYHKDDIRKETHTMTSY